MREPEARKGQVGGEKVTRSYSSVSKQAERTLNGKRPARGKKIGNRQKGTEAAHAPAMGGIHKKETVRTEVERRGKALAHSPT